MRQQRASIDEATCASENAYDDKQMIQQKVSRYGATRANENKSDAEQMIQQRASTYEATRTSENAYDAKRSFFLLYFPTLWPYPKFKLHGLTMRIL